MNYFSHYHILDNQESPFLTLGAILPDLARDAKPQYESLFEVKLPVGNNRDLQVGIWSHIESDKYFHNGDFFKTTTKEISAIIRGSEEVSLTKYTYFLAHILLELIIDHLLILKNPEQLVRFYQLISQTNDAEIASFIREHLPQYDVEFFLSKKEQFLKKQFLRDYSDTTTLVNVSYHILRKVGIHLLREEEKAGLKQLITNRIIPYILPLYEDHLSALKSRLWGKSLYSSQA
ncbi:MAG: hypothetical protein KTR13_01370 [Saprospiraceae bacterium]|nr:hypothetical protein [Saprospiraceae bacterium]